MLRREIVACLAYKHREWKVNECWMKKTINYNLKNFVDNLENRIQESCDFFIQGVKNWLSQIENA